MVYNKFSVNRVEVIEQCSYIMEVITVDTGWVRIHRIVFIY